MCVLAKHPTPTDPTCCNSCYRSYTLTNAHSTHTTDTHTNTHRHIYERGFAVELISDGVSTLSLNSLSKFTSHEQGITNSTQHICKGSSLTRHINSRCSDVDMLVRLVSCLVDCLCDRAIVYHLGFLLKGVFCVSLLFTQHALHTRVGTQNFARSTQRDQVR